MCDRAYAGRLARGNGTKDQGRWFDVERRRPAPLTGEGPRRARPATPGDTPEMTLQRMDNILINVEDMEAAKAFFTERGMKLEGETTVEGPWADRVVGLEGVRADIAMMVTPDGHGRADASQSRTQWDVRTEQ